MKRYAPAIVVLAVAFTSLSSILIRLSTAPPLVISAWRMIIASAILLPVTLYSHRRASGHAADHVPGGTISAGEVLGVPTRARTVLIIGASGLFLALHFASWISSLQYTSVLHSTVLVTVHPAIVLVASAILNRRPPTRIRVVATLAALAGAVLLATGGSVAGRVPTLRGDLLAVLGAVAIAGYLVIGGWARRFVSAGTYNIAVHSVASVALVGAALAFGDSLGGYAPIEYLLFAALAFFCTILGHALMNWALEYVEASDVSLAILLEPVFASLLAAFLFEEIPGPRTVVGAVVVLASLALVLLQRSKKA